MINGVTDKYISYLEYQKEKLIEYFLVRVATCP